MGFSGEIVSSKSHFEEFVCAVCSELVDLEANVVTTCHHIFCSACMDEWLARRKSCPVCQNDLSLKSTGVLPPLRHASPLAFRVLSRVEVRCPLQCGWEGDYGGLQMHLENSEQHDIGKVSEEEKEKVALNLKEQANAKLEARNFKDAMRLYTKSIAVHDGIPAIWSNRAALHLKLADFEAALSDARKAVELDKNYGKAYLRCGKALIGLGRFDEAVTVVENAPKHVIVAPEFISELHEHHTRFKAAEKAIKEKDFATARKNLTELMAVTAAPNVLLMAARCEYEIGVPERALKLALRVLRAQPNEPSAFVVRALALLFSGDVDESLKYVKEALRLSPDDSEALSAFRLIKNVRKIEERAKKASNSKDYLKAVDEWTTLLEVEMPARCLLRAWALAERANAHYYAQKFDDALKGVAKALYIQEDNKRAWLTKAYVLHAQGRHEDALKELEGLMQVWGSGDAVIRGAFEKAKFEVRKIKRPDYYAILTPEGEKPLNQFSSELEIKHAYRRKSLTVHPDRVSKEEDKKKAESDFKLLGEALEYLTDSFKRKLWDEGFDKEAIDEKVRRAEAHHQ